MKDKEFQEWLSRSEEFQQEESALDRRLEKMKRIMKTVPAERRFAALDSILKIVEKDRKRGISTDESLARQADDAEEFQGF